MTRLLVFNFFFFFFCAQGNFDQKKIFLVDGKERMLKEEAFTSMAGTYRNTNDKEYKTHDIATAIIKLKTSRLSSLLGTNAIFNVFVRLKSL